MRLLPNESKQVASLLEVLISGEELARDCARAQAELARDRLMRRFFLAQARQESFHVGVFHALLLALSPKGAGGSWNALALARYRRLIEGALARGDLGETLIAQQVILEGLGEVVLTHLDRGMGKRKIGIERLHRLVLSQEQAHHGFGLSRLEQMVTNGQTSRGRLQEQAGEYLSIIDSLLAELSEVFEIFDEDPVAYASETRCHLPHWLGGAA